MLTEGKMGICPFSLKGKWGFVSSHPRENGDLSPLPAQAELPQGLHEAVSDEQYREQEFSVFLKFAEWSLKIKYLD